MANSEADQLLDQLFRELSDGICLSDSAGRIIYLNPASLKMLELPAEAAADRSICALICGRLAAPGLGNECASKCALRQNSAQAATFQGRYELAPAFEADGLRALRKPRWKDLRVRCVRVQTALFDSWEPNKQLTIIQDATAEMDVERHKEDWRNMIAHDLRTPLTNIFGMAKVFKVEQHAMDLTSPEVQSLSNDDLASVITQGKNGHMPAFGQTLSQDEIHALMSYVRSLGSDVKPPHQ